MDIFSQPHSASTAKSPTHARIGGDAVHECDWCGRAVHRETAYERVQRGADGIEVVVLCPECELGSD